MQLNITRHDVGLPPGAAVIQPIISLYNRLHPGAALHHDVLYLPATTSLLITQVQMKKKTIWDLNRVSVDEYRRSRKIPLTVVLDNVRSLNNIGSIFRTSDAFAVERILLCGITATPPSSEIHKTALGAEDSVQWVYFEHTVDAVNMLKDEGYTVCALEQVEGSVSLERFEADATRKYAFIAGNEVDGVDQNVVNLCDVSLEIPQVGTKHSLNVAVSTAITIWHFFLKLR